MTAKTNDMIMKLQEKYNPLRSREVTDQPATATRTAANVDNAPVTPGAPAHLPPWMTSLAVVSLVECLQKHQASGIILFERNGEYGLQFDPPINAATLNTERGKVASNMVSLLDAATDDLKAMSAEGIEIPLLIRQIKTEGKE